MCVKQGLEENRYALRWSDVNLIHSDAINYNYVGFNKTFGDLWTMLLISLLCIQVLLMFF